MTRDKSTEARKLQPGVPCVVCGGPQGECIELRGGFLPEAVCKKRPSYDQLKAQLDAATARAESAEQGAVGERRQAKIWHSQCITELSRAEKAEARITQLDVELAAALVELAAADVAIVEVKQPLGGDSNDFTAVPRPEGE